MKLFLLCGSHNTNSQSMKVTQFVALRAEDQGFKSTFILDLATNPLPFWTAHLNKTDEGTILSLSQEINQSEALVIITPEWSGMTTPAIKNFFLHFSSSVLFHKPALIVAVSAGQGGAYPVAELRSSSYKNTKLCYIPDHIIIRNVENILNDSKPSSPEDKLIHKRIDFSLLVLKEYALALAKVRSSGIDFEEFPYGM